MLTEELLKAEYEVQRLEAELAAAKTKWHNLRCHQYGICVGDRVRYMSPRPDRQKEGIVTKITFSSYSQKPWVEAAKIKKDGNPSQYSMSFYSDWEKVDG
jgi:hypothetical protein